VGPVAGSLPPEGDLVGPAAGTSGLTQADVSAVISQAVATAHTTRAVIRLPAGSRTRMTIAIADLDGTILGLHRMPDATVFSIDVAVAKARNVIYFSSPAGAADLPGVPSGTAVTNRTIVSRPSPCSLPASTAQTLGRFSVCFRLTGLIPAHKALKLQSQPKWRCILSREPALYKNGVLVGGLGVSGDGVDQDDYVTTQAVRTSQHPHRSARTKY